MLDKFGIMEAYFSFLNKIGLVDNTDVYFFILHGCVPCQLRLSALLVSPSAINLHPLIAIMKNYATITKVGWVERSATQFHDFRNILHNCYYRDLNKFQVQTKPKPAICQANTSPLCCSTAKKRSDLECAIALLAISIARFTVDIHVSYRFTALFSHFQTQPEIKFVQI